MNKFPEKINKIAVSSFNEDGGILTQPSHFEFNYTGEQSVSLLMPVIEKPYMYGTVHPVFTQNLPEGYVRHYLYERLQRHAKMNDMYLLALQGSKSIGHLSYDGGIPEGVQEQISLNDIITWDSKESLFGSLLDGFYLNGLASGVQPKVLVPLNEVTTITQQEVIVKTFEKDVYDLLTVNEFVCMSAAADCNLAPRTFWLSNDLQCFITQRFDINGQERMALEDFASLMGKSGDEKYHSSYEMVMKATSMFTQSPEEVIKAFKYIAFNCLIGNGDAHLKNFSVTYKKGRTAVKLSPLYDVTHTLIYDTLDDRMALKMNKSKVFPSFIELTRLGESYGVPSPKHIITELSELIHQSINKSEVIGLMPNLKASIEKSLLQAKAGIYESVKYQQDRHRKFI